MLRILASILFGWVGTIVIIGACFLLIAHEVRNATAFYRSGLLILWGIVSLLVSKKEFSAKNRFVFLNFFVFGVIAQIVAMLYYFTPSLFPDAPFAGLYAYEYLSLGGEAFVELTVIAFFVLSMMSRYIGSLRTYAFSVVIASAVFIYFFHPIVLTPKYYYTTPNVTDFRIIDRAWNQLKVDGKDQPTPEEIADRISLSRWEGRNRVGELQAEEKVRRVYELAKYLNGKDYLLLLYKPMYESKAGFGFVCLSLLGISLVYRFVKDPPSSAYVEKIELVLMAFCCFEVFHYQTFAELKSYEIYTASYEISVLFSVLSIIGLTVLSLLRLKFLLSIEGKFADSRVREKSSSVTRWRDDIDNAVIRHFFGQTDLFRRMAEVQGPHPSRRDLGKSDQKQEKNLLRKISEFFRKNS